MRSGLDERERRLFAAAEAGTAGYGGVSAVARATGIARSTINRGLKDLIAFDLAQQKVRRAGGGRPSLTQTDPTLLEDLQRLLEPATLGDPMRLLVWVSKSHAKLAAALRSMGHQVSASRIPQLLERLNYRRQVNRKTKEGSHHPDRDAQFEHINKQVMAFQAAGQPVISVDTKKKELVGDYKNSGSDYRPEGCPDKVNVHDFVDKELGKAIPYGVYDISANAGYVSVGIDHDTAEFAVNSIHRWREMMGQERYPATDRLMITADGGGSNGSRVRLWKVKRGRPLTSRLAIVELIAATTTKTGLTVRCELDTNAYSKGIKVSDAEMVNLNIKGDAFHPEWNYTISPRSPKTST